MLNLKSEREIIKSCETNPDLKVGGIKIRNKKVGNQPRIAVILL